MNKAKRRRLEAAGWKFGDASDFLNLTPQEVAFIEIKLALAREIKKLRKARRLTQAQAAKLILEFLFQPHSDLFCDAP